MWKSNCLQSRKTDIARELSNEVLAIPPGSGDACVRRRTVATREARPMVEVRPTSTP